MRRVLSAVVGVAVMVALATPGFAQQSSPPADPNRDHHRSQPASPGGMGGPGMGGMMGGPMMMCPRVGGQPEAQRLQMCGEILKARADMLKAFGDVMLKYGKMMEKPGR